MKLNPDTIMLDLIYLNAVNIILCTYLKYFNISSIFLDLKHQLKQLSDTLGIMCLFKLILKYPFGNISKYRNLTLKNCFINIQRYFNLSYST